MSRPAPWIAAAGLLLVGGVLAPTGAAAQVLTEGGGARLCLRDRVVPGRLAIAMIGEARATAFAATANAGGTSPEDLTEAEAVSVMSALDQDVFPARGGPFGPDIDLARDKEAADAWERLRRLVVVELGRLAVEPKTVGARVFRLTLRGSTASVESYDPSALFDPRPAYEIRCEAAPASGDAPGPQAPARSTPAPSSTPASTPASTAAVPPAETFPPSWRVRATASDLHLWTEDLSTLKAATLGFSRDEVANTETINVNGVVGLAFETDDLVWSAIPFVSWQYKDVTGAGDIDKLSPGVVLAQRIEESGGALHSRLELAYLIDREQSSEQIKTRLYLDPTFNTATGYLFGDWLDPTARLRIRPDLTIIGDVSEVRDAGSSPALIAGGSYRGLGGDLRVLFDYPALEGASLLVGRRQLWLSGDLTIDEAARWYAKLEYKWKTSPIGIALTFSQGENDDTFQEEDTTALELTFRR